MEELNSLMANRFGRAQPFRPSMERIMLKSSHSSGHPHPNTHNTNCRDGTNISINTYFHSDMLIGDENWLHMKRLSPHKPNIPTNSLILKPTGATTKVSKLPYLFVIKFGLQDNAKVKMMLFNDLIEIVCRQRITHAPSIPK